MVSYKFPKCRRISKSKEFIRVREKGQIIQNKYFKMIFSRRENIDESSRLGIIVSKKFGNSVRRNKIKRLIREAFRLIYPNLKIGFDLIIIVRMGADNPKFGYVDQYLRELLKNSGILETQK